MTRGVLRVRQPRADLDAVCAAFAATKGEVLGWSAEVV